MTRKLLPYEHDLIAQLGVTEEEYLEFLDIQIDYTISNEQRFATPQAFVAPVIAAGAVAATAAATTAALITNISIALTVVGVLFQVASVLLAKTPSDPRRKQGGQREQRFSPRFGFNSGQELAQYGDPVNLVYCNISQNPNGGVRIGTSLVWSSVESYGSTQFMQLLLVLGAAKIKTLDFDRTAFGQLPLRQFSESNTWLYYPDMPNWPGNDDGRVKFTDKKLGDGKDPTRDGAPGSEDVCRVMFAKNRRDGYSQAFSPSSLTSIGVYDPIPLNIEIQERRSSGKPQWGNLQITIGRHKPEEGDYGTEGNVSYAKGNQITVVFAKALKRQDKVVQEAAKDMRYQLAESLDRASTYMLGTAKFRLVSVNGGNEVNLDNNDIEAKFECIEAGRRPVTDYRRTRTKIWDEDDREELQNTRDILDDDLTGAEETAIDRLKESSPNNYGRISSTVFVDDYRFTVASGKTIPRNFDKDNTNGQVDQVSGSQFNVPLKAFGFPKDYNFTKDREVKWNTELWNANDSRANRALQEKTLIIPSSGSIAVSRKILSSFLANKPKLDVAALRDEIENDLEAARALRDRINAGDFDKALRKAVRDTEDFKTKHKNPISEKREKLEGKIKDLVGIDKKVATISGTEVLKKGTDLTKKEDNGIAANEKALDDLVDGKEDYITAEVANRRKAAINQIRNSTESFTGIDGITYGSGGIKAMKRRLARLKGQVTTDQVGVKAVRDALNELIKEKEDAKNDLKLLLKNWEDFIADADDDFFTKCLVKIESAAYQTVTDCNFVKFAIRCKLFRRISGRAKDYGQNEAPDGYRLSDNGIHGRMAFFKVSYKEIGSPNYKGFPMVFAVQRGADQDNFIGLAFKGPSRSKWEFKFDPIGDIAAETERGETHIAFIKNEGRVRTFEDGRGATFAWTGSIESIPNTGIHSVLKERGPLYTNEWDLFSNRSDTQIQFSFDSGPEFRITAVTEQQAESIVGKYSSLSMMAMGIFSGRGVQDLRSITAYVTEGKESWVVNASNGNYSLSNRSTSFAPDIFADTILDRENGIGKYAKPEGVDWQNLALAKRFCTSNGLLGTNGKPVSLFMDGVIADLVSWRQFWAETAPFSLLEFARVGGRETLIPAIPVDHTGKANRQININALFTAGNILEGSYKEEFIDYGDSTQDLIATVIYRETEAQEVFPRNASVQVHIDPRQGFSEANAIRQTFDLSQFVTQKEQAILFAKLICNQRRYMRRGVEFKTFPTDSPISPGAYIFVDIGFQPWDQITSGMIMDGGVLNAPLLDSFPTGSTAILIYKNGQNVESWTAGQFTIVDGVITFIHPTTGQPVNRDGYMFVLGRAENRKRVFRVTEVQMDEEGEVTVKAMEHACETVDGQLLSKVANFTNSLFTVR
jgi:hypothetical protein